VPIHNASAQQQFLCGAPLAGRYDLQISNTGQIRRVERNRGEMRFINNKGFSTRYRNRLQVERDFDPGGFR